MSLLIRKPWDKIGGKVSYLEDELFVLKAKINIAIFWNPLEKYIDFIAPIVQKVSQKLTK